MSNVAQESGAVSRWRLRLAALVEAAPMLPLRALPVPRWGVAALAVLAALMAFTPLHLHHAGAGLDPSWMAVLGEARALGLHFGTDIVFTGGPLSSLYTNYFAPDMLGYHLAGKYVLAGFFALALVALIRRTAFSSAHLVLLLVVGLMTMVDVHFIAVPLLALGLYVAGVSYGLVLAGMAASGIAILAKFSVFPIALVVALLLDILRLSRREVPLAMPVLWLVLYGAFALVTGAPQDFAGYLKASFETSAGYTQAMSIMGSPLTFPLYLWLLGDAVFCYQRGVREQAQMPGRLAVAALSLGLAVFVWSGFKHGFVRHDGHVASAFGAVALGAALVGVLFADRNAAWLTRRLMTIGMISMLVCSVIASGASLPRQWAGALMEPERTMRAALDPSGWFAMHMEGRKTSLAALSYTLPMGRLYGSVDTIPSVQSALIGQGQDYRPRPSIQEYTSYSAPLIARNRAFFAAETRPDFLLFQPGSIDRRHPASAEGPLWPDFLRLYRPARPVGEMWLLERRETALGELLGPPVTHETRLDAPFDIPAGEDALFMRFDIRLTALGRLFEIIWKVPSVRIYLGYGDGRTVHHRLVVPIAREGLFIVPHIADAASYVRMAQGEPRSAFADQPRSLRVDADILSWLFYRQEMTITTQALDRSKL